MEDEKIYELTAQILVLAYSPEDARERAERQVVINDVLEDPIVTDWSHLDDKIFPKRKQNTIDRITREINKRER